MNTTPRFAASIVAAYQRTKDATRPIDRKTAEAEFLGFCKAADALGLVHTPDHMHLIVLDAYRAQLATEPRPPAAFGSPSRNALMVAWDNAVAVKVYEAVMAL